MVAFRPATRASIDRQPEVIRRLDHIEHSNDARTSDRDVAAAERRAADAKRSGPQRPVERPRGPEREFRVASRPARATGDAPVARRLTPQGVPGEGVIEPMGAARSVSAAMAGACNSEATDTCSERLAIRLIDGTAPLDASSSSELAEESDRVPDETARPTTAPPLELVVQVPTVVPSRSGEGGAGRNPATAADDEAQCAARRNCAIESIEKCVQWMSEIALDVSDQHSGGGSPAVTLTLRGDGTDVGQRATSVTLVSEGRGRVRVRGALLDELCEEDRLELSACLRARGLVVVLDDNDE
jgi:hypothetical protein